MIKQILINEIKDAIGHTPDKRYIKSCLKYLSEQLTNKSTLAEIGLEIFNWRHDILVKCDECGDYFLPSDIVEEIDGYKFCSDTCIIDWKEKQKW